jgi:hypothetical protein
MQGQSTVLQELACLIGLKGDIILGGHGRPRLAEAPEDMGTTDPRGLVGPLLAFHDGGLLVWRVERYDRVLLLALASPVR